MTTAMDHARHARRDRHLEAARRAYRERFAADAPVSSYLGHPRLADLLMEAVEVGRPLTAEAVAAWLGAPRLDRRSGP
jgi:hypothetical protein